MGSIPAKNKASVLPSSKDFHWFQSGDSVTQTEPTTPSFAAGQQQMTQDLAALRQTVEQLAGGQDQMAREIRRRESAVAELNAKIRESPQPPMPVPPLSRTR